MTTHDKFPKSSHVLAALALASIGHIPSALADNPPPCDPCRLDLPPAADPTHLKATVGAAKKAGLKGWAVPVTWNTIDVPHGAYTPECANVNHQGLQAFDGWYVPTTMTKTFYMNSGTTRFAMSDNFYARYFDPCKGGPYKSGGSTYDLVKVKAPTPPPVGGGDGDGDGDGDGGGGNGDGGGDPPIEPPAVDPNEGGEESHDPCPQGPFVPQQCTPFQHPDTRVAVDLLAPTQVEIVAENISFNHHKNGILQYNYEPATVPVPKYFLQEHVETQLEGGNPESPVGGSITWRICPMTGELIITQKEGNPSWYGVRSGANVTLTETTASGSFDVSGYDDCPNLVNDTPAVMMFAAGLADEYTKERMRDDAFSHAWEFKGEGYYRQEEAIARLLINQSENRIEYTKTKYKIRVPENLPRPYHVNWVEEFTPEDPNPDDYQVPEKQYVTKSATIYGNESGVYTIDPQQTPDKEGVWVVRMPQFENAPEVLAVNSDFDEGHLDPTTGFSIPDCCDSTNSLKAERDHLDGRFSMNEIVTEDLHQGFFGMSPSIMAGRFGDEFADGATITIAKIATPDAEFGGDEEGQVRMYATWESDGQKQFQMIEPYDPKTLVPANLVGVVYGSSASVPRDATFWLEGTHGGKITLEWKCRNGSSEIKHTQQFLVATHKTRQEWLDDIAYELRLESSDDIGGEVDIGGFGTTGTPPFASQKELLYEMYDYYRELFLQNYGIDAADRDEVMAWYGLARCTTGEIVGGLSVMEDAYYTSTLLASGTVPPTPVDPFGTVINYLITTSPGKLNDIQEALLLGARDIFQDLAWQGRAYRASGIYALKYADSLSTTFRYDGWKEIDSGRRTGDIPTIRKGVVKLADREQNIVVQPAFNMLKAITLLPTWPASFDADELFTLLSENTVPGGTSFFVAMPVGSNVADAADRWTWVTGPGGVIPTFYTKTPLQHQQLNEEYIEVRSRDFIPRKAWPGEERLLETEWKNDMPSRHHGTVYVP